MKRTATRGALGVAFEVKSIDEKARTFTGLAATWKKDLGDDVIHKGAFARTLTHWRSTKATTPIPLLDGHDRYSVLKVMGKMTGAKETDDGLEADFEFIPEDPDADAALRRVKGGFVSGLSIGYTPVRWEYEQIEGKSPWERIRHLHEVKLHEVSLVVFPMNETARVDRASMKSLIDAAREGTLTDEEKQELRALLDAPDDTRESGPPSPVKGLAPDDPKRLATEHLLRDLKLRRLGTA